MILIDDDDIFSEDIACEDIVDDEIAPHILRFNKSKWDFSNTKCYIFIDCYQIN